MKTLTILTLTLGAAACSVGDPAQSDAPLTYEQFRGRALHDAETGSYVINGDELVADEAELRTHYDNYLISLERLRDAEQGIGTTQENLTVNRVGNPPRDDRWASPKSLTYCISSGQFGANYQRVVTAMAGASADWAAVASVKFTHVPANDVACSVLSGNTFSVETTIYPPGLLARAFFPSSPWYERNLVINLAVVDKSAPVTLRGLLRHELGHVLGFRHEHTRPEAGTQCLESTNWRPLTAYDSASVMHYPWCNGSTNKGDMVLTALDRAGARALYP